MKQKTFDTVLAIISYTFLLAVWITSFISLRHINITNNVGHSELFIFLYSLIIPIYLTFYIIKLFKG